MLQYGCMCAFNCSLEAFQELPNILLHFLKLGTIIPKVFYFLYQSVFFKVKTISKQKKLDPVAIYFTSVIFNKDKATGS